MQMNIIENSLAQRGSLPLPSAALVIDMRGVEDDDVMNRLRIEIMDLAGEMKTHEINHWRFLTEFLSFRSITPLRSEDMETIYTQQKLPAKQAPTKPKENSLSPKGLPTTGLTGRVDMVKQSHTSTPFEMEGAGGGMISNERPFDVFQQHIEELAQEINRIRNNRIAAVADLNKSGIAGRSVRDATVRIIFLTEAGNPESLNSVAAYVAKLKEYFVKLERENHQPLVSTTVLYLNHSGEAGPPTDLILGLQWNNDWKHIDSLLISEQFREDAALIKGTIQTYLAELLLYVLLIIPPLTINSTSEAQDPSVALLEKKETDTEKPKGKWLHLPASSYVVGLASIEHSARWGRRWINYGIAARAIELLQDKEGGDELGRRRVRSQVENWLNHWFGQVAQAIPDNIPGNIPALSAIPSATNVSLVKQKTVTSQEFTLTIGQTTLRDLREYLATLLDTYTPKGIQGAAQRKQASQDETYTLQDALDSIPQIEQRLREWEEKDPARRKGTPLVDAQIEAQRVLSNPKFFVGIKGAIPRARMQLKELGTAISKFKNDHDQNTQEMDLEKRKRDLEKRGTSLINDLEEHVKGTPLLAAKLRLRFPMALLTQLLFFFLAVFITFFVIAWLLHIVFLNAPTSWVSNVGDVLASQSIGAYLIWAVIVIGVIVLAFFLGRPIFDHKRTNAEVESIFLITLFTASLTGILLTFSVNQFVNDPSSSDLLGWLSFLGPVSLICFILTITIIIIESIWFVWWRGHLFERRNSIALELQSLHQKDVDDVTTFITEAVGLHILTGAELTDGHGGPGPYYARIDQLHKRLTDIGREADQQQRLAAHRLVMSMSEIQPGTTSNANEPWLNLKIREEWLDVNSLADGYKRLQEHLEKENEELQELSELLLRIMGKEKVIDIEQQFSERILASREQSQTRVFLSTLLAITTRFSIAPDSVTSLTPILERYENIESQMTYQQPALGALVELLRKKAREATIQPLISDEQLAGNTNMGGSPEVMKANMHLATDGFAAWGQMLWEDRDARLDKALMSTGVLAKLMEGDDYDARAVMRRLQVHTALFGRSISGGQTGELRLILSPSAQSRTFRQSLNIPSRLIIDFPDIERLLLLYIQRYNAEPLFLPDPEQETNPVASSNTGTPGEA